MNPLDNIVPWLNPSLLAQATSTLVDGCPFAESDRYSLAFAITEELERLDLAVAQLKLAESKWWEASPPRAVFNRGMTKLRQERADVEAARLTYKHALRILRLSEERKTLRNALHEAAIDAHRQGYSVESLATQAGCAAAWIGTTDIEQGAA